MKEWKWSKKSINQFYTSNDEFGFFAPLSGLIAYSLRNVTTEADYVSSTGRNWVCADTAVSRPSPAIGTFLSIVQNVAMANMQFKAIVLAE